MPVFYKLRQEKREGAKNVGMWYANAKMVGSLNLKEISKRIEGAVSVRESDVYAVLIELRNVMQEYLMKSYAIKIENLGTFRVGIKTNPAASAGAFKANTNIKGYRINFQPETYYPQGTGKGSKRVTKLIDGITAQELPKNAVDTTLPVNP